jgi:hypothetical protein
MIYFVFQQSYLGRKAFCHNSKYYFQQQTYFSELSFIIVQTRQAVLGNDQLDALFLNVFIFMPLHVPSSKCLSSGGPNFINTSPGITHSGGWVTDVPV